jgi:FkbM family methyltransferase
MQISANQFRSGEVAIDKQGLIAALDSANALSKFSRYFVSLRQPIRTARIAYFKYRNSVHVQEAPLFYGSNLSCVIPETVSKFIYRFGFFEYELTHGIIDLLKPGQTFIDVGAHIGYFSLLAAHLVGSEGRVLALEPTPRTRAVTLRNLANFTNVTVLDCAAWHESATLKFYDYGWTHSALNSAFRGRREVLDAACKSIYVPARSLDQIINDLGVVPNFIKVDAEAAELNVLRGAESTLRKYSPVVSIEVGDYTEGGEQSRTVIEYAMALGYYPFDLVAGTLVPHKLKTNYTYNNLILKKNKMSLA